MTVYVVERYYNDYVENGGGYQGIEGIFTSEEKAKEFYNSTHNLFGEIEDEAIYYEYFAMEVQE